MKIIKEKGGGGGGSSFAKTEFRKAQFPRAQEMRESRGGCSGSPSLMVLVVSVDVNQH